MTEWIIPLQQHIFSLTVIYQKTIFLYLKWEHTNIHNTQCSAEGVRSVFSFDCAPFCVLRGWTRAALCYNSFYFQEEAARAPSWCFHNTRIYQEMQCIIFMSHHITKQSCSGAHKYALSDKYCSGQLSNSLLESFTKHRSFFWISIAFRYCSVRFSVQGQDGMTTGCEYCLKRTPNSANKAIIPAGPNMRRKGGVPLYQIFEISWTDATSAFSLRSL